ncbi:MAG: RluA family pseudouridine synthase [Legionellaceae bacterium]|nr:RluA family pseudouridine synthase [Legionellaceae bacterium]
MTEVTYKEISEDESGQRLDNYLLRELKGVPKSHIYRIIRSGEVRANKKRVRPDYRLQTADRIRLPPLRTSEKDATDWTGSQVAARLKEVVVYEDECFLVINKPTGIAVHGGSGLKLGVIEALRQLRSDLHYLELVHRIDRETSGCLVLAKKRSALRALHRLLEAREVDKMYWTLVHGSWTAGAARTVDAPLIKNQLQSGERLVKVDPTGKPSLTELKVLETMAEASLLEARPRTGRTHQIRVHCASIGHSIINDAKYAPKEAAPLFSALDGRLYLHAKTIRFNLEGRHYHFDAPLDQKFADAIEQLRARN